MAKEEKTENFIKKGIEGFLSDKPIWVWWLSHILLTGALFGVFYLIFYLLTIQAWIAVLVLIATGLIWGTAAYSDKNKKAEKQTGTEEV